MRFEHRKPPIGILANDFDGLQKAGCIQAELEVLRPMFRGLYVATSGNPCDGCPVWESKGPSCQAYKLYHSEARQQAHQRESRIASAVAPGNRNGDRFAGMTVAQIAAELHVSKSEVRRRKVAGTL